MEKRLSLSMSISASWLLTTHMLKSLCQATGYSFTSLSQVAQGERMKSREYGLKILPSISMRAGVVLALMWILLG